MVAKGKNRGLHLPQRLPHPPRRDGGITKKTTTHESSSTKLFEPNKSKNRKNSSKLNQQKMKKKLYVKTEASGVEPPLLPLPEKTKINKFVSLNEIYKRHEEVEVFTRCQASSKHEVISFDEFDSNLLEDLLETLKLSSNNGMPPFVSSLLFECGQYSKGTPISTILHSLNKLTAILVAHGYNKMGISYDNRIPSSSFINISMVTLSDEIIKSKLMHQLISYLWTTDKELLKVTMKLLHVLLVGLYRRSYSIHTSSSYIDIITHAYNTASTTSMRCVYDEITSIESTELLNEFYCSKSNDRENLCHRVVQCPLCFSKFDEHSKYRWKMIQQFLSIEGMNEIKIREESGLNRVLQLTSSRDMKIRKYATTIACGLISIVLETPLKTEVDLTALNEIQTKFYHHIRMAHEEGLRGWWIYFMKYFDLFDVHGDIQCIRSIGDAWLSVVVLKFWNKNEWNAIDVFEDDGLLLNMKSTSKRVFEYIIEFIGGVHDSTSIAICCDLLCMIGMILLRLLEEEGSDMNDCIQSMMEMYVREMNERKLMEKLMYLSFNSKVVLTAVSEKQKNYDSTLMRLQLSTIRIFTLICQIIDKSKIDEEDEEGNNRGGVYHQCMESLCTLWFFDKTTNKECTLYADIEEYGNNEEGDVHQGFEYMLWHFTIRRLHIFSKQTSNTSMSTSTIVWSQLNGRIFLYVCKCICIILLYVWRHNRGSSYLKLINRSSLIPLLKYGLTQQFVWMSNTESHLPLLIRFWCSYAICILCFIAATTDEIVSILKRYNDGICIEGNEVYTNRVWRVSSMKYLKAGSCYLPLVNNLLSVCNDSSASFQFVEMNAFVDIVEFAEELWKIECLLNAEEVDAIFHFVNISNLSSHREYPSVMLYLISFIALQHILNTQNTFDGISTEIDLKRNLIDDVVTTMMEDIPSSLDDKLHQNNSNKILYNKLYNQRGVDVLYTFNRESTSSWSSVENPFVLLLRKQISLQSRIEVTKYIGNSKVLEAAQWILNRCFY